MVVMPINQRNPHIFLCKLLGKTYAAESGTDNDNMFLICHNTPLLIFNSEKNHIVGSFSPFEKHDMSSFPLMRYIIPRFTGISIGFFARGSQI